METYAQSRTGGGRELDSQRGTTVPHYGKRGFCRENAHYIMRSFLIRWVTTTVAVMVAAFIVPGMYYTNIRALLMASLVLGLLNALLKPLLMILSLPLLLITFGLFTWGINSLLLLLASNMVNGFVVNGWWSAMGGSLIISIVMMVLKRVEATAPPRPPPAATSQVEHPPGTERGRVIDV